MFERTRPQPGVESSGEWSGTLGLHIIINGALKERRGETAAAGGSLLQPRWRRSELLYPPRRKILPLLQSGPSFIYTYPGFRYAPPWAEVYRHSVARIAFLETTVQSSFPTNQRNDAAVHFASLQRATKTLLCSGGDLNPILGFCFPLFSRVFPWRTSIRVETCGK
jgi:hypothetical protein